MLAFEQPELTFFRFMLKLVIQSAEPCGGCAASSGVQNQISGRHSHLTPEGKGCCKYRIGYIWRTRRASRCPACLSHSGVSSTNKATSVSCLLEYFRHGCCKSITLSIFFIHNKELLPLLGGRVLIA